MVTGLSPRPVLHRWIWRLRGDGDIAFVPAAPDRYWAKHIKCQTEMTWRLDFYWLLQMAMVPSPR